MPKISASVNINSVLLKEQGAAPATPASGYDQLFMMAGGLYLKPGLSGQLIGPLGPVNHAAVGGRLTLTTLTPVTTADVAAATNVYWTPDSSDRIDLFDGVVVKPYSFNELTIPLGGLAASLPYDVFLYPDGSNVVQAESLVWASATARATALVSQNGMLCKTGALTRRFVGTFRTTATIGQCEDSLVARFVSNYYNIVPRIVYKADATASWTYNSTTPRQTRATVGNKVEWVTGVLRRPNRFTFTDYCGAFAVIGIGINSITAYTDSIQMSTANAAVMVDTHGQIGYNYASMMEHSTSGTNTFYGSDTNRPRVCFMTGYVWG